MKSVKIAIAAVAVTIVAVIATILIVSSGTGDYGLYITDFSGKVDITVTGQGSAAAVKGARLDQNSIVTVSGDGTCKLTYVTKNNDKDNYVILESNTQIIISDEFKGKSDGNIFLLQGTVLNNSYKKTKAGINVRTNSSLFTTDKSVSVINVSKTDNGDVCDFYCFYGNNSIQMFDSLGNKIDELQYIIEKKKGRISEKDTVPMYEYLNIDFELSELSAESLKELVTISNFVDDFTYSTAELRDAYKNAPTDVPAEKPPVVPETTPAETITSYVTTETSAYTATLPPENNYVATETTKQDETQTEPINSDTVTDSDKYFLVQIVVDGEVELQEVPYGGNAEQPADPEIDGLIFKGWDNSFENITKDTTITAIFESENENPGTSDTSNNDNNYYCTVTINVAGNITTKQVKYGESADLPTVIEVPGYVFSGWDRDYTHITSDVTITAILIPVSSQEMHTVTFVAGNKTYSPVYVRDGGTVLPPSDVPETDSRNATFFGWDKPLTNITQDLIITAEYKYMVTFIANGTSYVQRVSYGESVTLPEIPLANSLGQNFIGWDKEEYEYRYVTDNITITAIYR